MVDVGKDLFDKIEVVFLGESKEYGGHRYDKVRIDYGANSIIVYDLGNDEGDKLGVLWGIVSDWELRSGNEMSDHAMIGIVRGDNLKDLLGDEYRELFNYVWDEMN